MPIYKLTYVLIVEADSEEEAKEQVADQLDQFDWDEPYEVEEDPSLSLD